jgi:hypothetical protein
MFDSQRVDTPRLQLPGTLTLLAENVEVGESFVSKAFLSQIEKMKVHALSLPCIALLRNTNPNGCT